MIRGDEHFAAGCGQGVLEPSKALVEAFHRRHRGAEDPGMPHHVAVRVVAQDQVEALRINGGDEAVGNLVGAHFGLQVVGGDLRAWYQDAFFAREGFLPAPRKEKGDVRVFLRFRDAQLPLAERSQRSSRSMA